MAMAVSITSLGSRTACTLRSAGEGGAGDGAPVTALVFWGGGEPGAVALLIVAGTAEALDGDGRVDHQLGVTHRLHSTIGRCERRGTKRRNGRCRRCRRRWRGASRS